MVAGSLFPVSHFPSRASQEKNAFRPAAHGFQDETRGTLFFDVLRVLMHHPAGSVPAGERQEPQKAMTRGRTFDVIKRKLTEELGYTLHTRIIDAANFVPQHRERIVMVGFREKTGFSFDDLVLAGRAGRGMRDVLHPGTGTEVPESHFTVGPGCKGERQIYAQRQALAVPAGIRGQAQSGRQRFSGSVW
nr:DNA cytosine methyltransferase [Loktanella sp. M215]